MAEVVDSIIAELILRDNGYVSGFDRATAAHDRFVKSMPKVAGGLDLSGAEAQKYADRHKRAANDVAGASEAAAGRVVKAAKTKSAAEVAAAAEIKAAAKATADAQRAAAKAASDAVKAAEREKQAALKATQREQEKAAAAAAKAAEAEKVAAAEAVAAMEREAATRARLSAVAARGVRNGAVPQGTGARLGVSVPREPSGQRTIPLGLLNGANEAEAVAEAEINHLMVDRALLQAGLIAASKEEAQVIREKLAEMTLIGRLQRAGLSDAEIALAIERQQLAVEEKRRLLGAGGNGGGGRGGRGGGSGGIGGFGRFAEGAGLGRSGGSGPAIAGILAATGVAALGAAAKSGLDYAHELKVVSDQLGITTHDLQIYQAVAGTVNVTQEQLREGLGRLADNLGKAQLGAETQRKQFRDLGIDVGNARDGFKTTSQILPTFLDVLSKIPDQAKRLAVETALGGEQLAKLDPVLSRGAGGFDKLAGSIAGTSDMLSDEQIQKAAETANKLKLLGDQLERDLSGVVANNAKEIETLATAFFRLADGALKALNASQRWFAFEALNTPGGTPEQRQFASDTINSTPEGRKQRMTRLRNSWNMLTEQHDPKNQSTSDLYVDGVGYINNTPQGRGSAKKQLLDQYRQIAATERADNPPPAPVQPHGKANLDDFFAPKPKKGKKGRSAASLDAEAQERTKRFNDQLASLQEESLRAQESLTGDIQAQADIEKQMADRALKKQLDDIEQDRKRNIDKGEAPKEANARAATLAAAAQAAHATQQQARDQQTLADLTRAQLAHLETRLTIEADLLSSQLALAKTAKERRVIELRLLDIAQQEEKARLEALIKASKPGDPAIADAQAQLAAMPAQRAAKAADINQRDVGPWQQYVTSLPHTADQVREAFEGAAVNGVEKLNDSLANTLTTMLHLHGIAGEFLNDLIKIGLHYAEAQLFGSAAGGTGSGSAGGILNSIGSAIGSVFGGGRAVGGAVSGGMTYLVGERGPELVHMGGSGTVYPNGALPNLMGGGGGTVINQHFTLDARFGITTPELLQHVNAVAGQRAAEAGQASYRASISGVPGAMSRYQQEKG